MAIEKSILPLAAAVIGAAGLNAQTPAAAEPEQVQVYTREQIREIVREIVSKNSGVPASKLQEEDDFINKLGMDSLDYVEMMIDVEKRFSIRLPDELLAKIMKVGELETWVEGMVGVE
jgi:acyl carrier protein